MPIIREDGEQTMTVGELRAALEGVPSQTPIRITGDEFCFGPLYKAELDPEDGLSFVLDTHECTEGDQ